MRKVGLLAFGVTSLVLIPGARHELIAGPRQVAKLVAPGASSFELGGATVDASIDRAIADPGDIVHVTLRATAPKPGKVQVGVLVLESLGTYNGRVPEPPDRVLLETVTLAAGPGGGAAREVAVRLPGRRELGEMQLGQYTIFVMEPKTAEELDKLRRSARREGARAGWDPMKSDAPKHDAFNELHDALESGGVTEDEDDMGAEQRVARLEVVTRPADSAVAIRAPERAVVGQEVTITVQVTNPTKRPIAALTVEIQEPPFQDGYLGLGFEHVSLPSMREVIALGPRESKQVAFRLTAQQAGMFGLYAAISCGACEDDARLHDGNLEAIEIVSAPTTPEAPAASPAVAASR